MPEAQCTILDESTLVCASSAACALLNATSPASLAEDVRSLLDIDELACTTEHKTVLRACTLAGAERKLQLSVCPVNGAELSRVTRIVQIECDAPESARAADQRQLRSEKTASIGQLGAGVAQKINDPLACVLSNFTTLAHYVDDMRRVISAYERRDARSSGEDEVAITKAQVSYDALVEDLPPLLSESREGIERIRKLVQGL